MTDDLWPDDIGRRIKLKAPVIILKEQGALLGTKTDNVVEGEIFNISDRRTARNPFEYAFYLAAPAFNYRYTLLTISHSVDLYPLVIYTDNDVFTELPDDMKRSGKKRGEHPILVADSESRHPILVADSESRFTEILKAIFATKKVRRVIEAIMAQSGVDIQPE